MNENAVEKVAYSAKECAAALGISKPKLYELMRRDDFPAFKLGGRTLISAQGLRDWVDAQVTAEKKFGICN